MTDHVDPTNSRYHRPPRGSSEQYVPVVGDRPEGTDVWQRVPYDADDYGPVTDFATDFDHADPAYNPNAPKVWKELREGGCPVAHSDRYGGMWVPLTHDTVNEVAYDTENFTSRAVVVIGRPPRRPGDAGTDRRRTADHQRPAVPQHGPPPAAAGVRARSRSSRGSPRSADCAEQLLDEIARHHARRDRHRRRGAVRPEHPGQRHRPHARLPGRGRATCSAGSSTTCSSASPRNPARQRRHGRPRQLHLRPDPRPPSEPPRRPHQLPAHTSRSTGSRSATTSSAA